MGFEVLRFLSDVDEELICSICSGVLEDPMQFYCQHAFCEGCIKEWLHQKQKQTCPVDRKPVSLKELAPSRLVKILLARLEIKCDHYQLGCQNVIKLDQLLLHSKECEYNPKKLVACTQGCGLAVPKDEMKDHQCPFRMFVWIKFSKPDTSNWKFVGTNLHPETRKMVSR